MCLIIPLLRISAAANGHGSGRTGGHSSAGRPPGTEVRGRDPCDSGEETSSSSWGQGEAGTGPAGTAGAGAEGQAGSGGAQQRAGKRQWGEPIELCCMALVWVEYI